MPERRTPDQGNLDDELTRSRFRRALNGFQQLAKDSGIVRVGLSGLKPNIRTGYIWTVLVEDYTPEQMLQDPRFSSLSEGAVTMLEQTRDHSPLRVAQVLPSKLPFLNALYTRAGYNLELMRVSEVAVDAPTTSVPDNADGLDMLIGGLEPYNDRLKRAQELAAIQNGYADIDEELEEAYGRDVFLTMRDKRAGEMLRAITFARNAALDGLGYAKGFEMLAEMPRVMAELVINQFAVDFDQLSVLDVTGAIESGALRPYFDTTQDWVLNDEQHIQRAGLA